MKILAIETSCDETSVAVVEDGIHVRSNTISSSKSAYEKLAGVIPEQAARKQLECMVPVLNEALSASSVQPKDIDLIAVTRGPGLLGSLLVGTVTARTISATWQKPLIGIHHTLGHLSSVWLRSKENLQPAPEFPILTLSASGGHTDIWHRTRHTQGKLLGRTRDDAAGEAFDKAASLLGLPYPGGPAIEKLGRDGNAQAFSFPDPLSGDDSFDFSFSGLKTSLKYLLRDMGDSEEAKNQRANVASSFQRAICLHLVHRVRNALEHFPTIREIHLVGGVSANSYLRGMMEELCRPRGVTVRWPESLAYCTDNAAMIAAAAFFVIKEHGKSALTSFETQASIPLESILTEA